MRTNFHKVPGMLVAMALSWQVCASDSPLGTTRSLSGEENATATIGVMAHSDFVPDRVNPQRGTKIGLPDLLADRMTEHLANSRRFQVVERTALRRLVLEQRFGANVEQTYLDRTLDKAIGSLDSVEGGGVVVGGGNAHPEGRANAGHGAVGTTGVLSDFNDLIKDFTDLGSAAGADYLVLGDLEKLERSEKITPVPYSDEGRTHRENIVDARLRIRVIDAANGTIAGADSLRARTVETLFEGRQDDGDQYTFFDQLAREAAARILDITFPARIVSLQPVVISRGRNDGVAEGDVFGIEREGKALKDANGIVIAHLKSSVGQVEVVAVQDTVAIVRPLTGDALQIGDLAGGQPDDTRPSAAGRGADAPGAAEPHAASVERPRLAVGLVKSGSTAETGSAAQKHTPIFTDTMISRLAQTKRFQLIDRQEVDQLLTEQLAQKQAVNEALPSAMGSLKGADYLVYGSLASFSTEERTDQLPNSNRIFKSKVGVVEGNMRIVDARSGDVIESRKIVVEQKIDAAMDGKRTVVALADAYAEQVVLMLMNAIYPIKVTHVANDGTLYVNRGGDGGLFPGETLRAFRLGESIVDPDTGIRLGREETPVGEVKLFEVEDATSKGTPAGGGRILKGDLLKRLPQNKGQRTTAAATAAAAPRRTGGDLTRNEGQAAGRTAAEKATLVMGTIRVNPSARTTGMAKGHIKRLSDELLVKLQNTNRFVLMERAEVDQLIDEKAFEAVAAGGDIGDRLREFEGADYLIHGELTNFYLDVKKSNVPYLDRTETTVNRVADGVFRIADVHSGRMLSAEKVSIREKVDDYEDANQIVGDLIDGFTTRSVAAIVSRLYPIKVLAMGQDGILYLNRGADGNVVQGDRFNLMRPGDEMIDPDTGRSFGRAETNVGLIEVVDVEATRARARIVSGGDARTGDVLRTAERAPPPAPPAVMQPAW
jgi:curli biogenesis system outer membrane secretion channel CsgG